MANKYAQSTGNWSAGGAGGIWYDAESGGSEVAKPAAGDVAYICDGAAVDIDEDVSCAQIKNVANTGYITVTANRTMTLTGNPGIDSSTTSTSGFIRVSANTLTITHDQGAGTTAVQQTAAGYAVMTSSTGAFTVSNSGGVALESASTGRALNSTGSGAVSITGNLSSGSGWSSASWVNSSTGTHTLDGGITTSGGYSCIWSAGTVNWTPPATAMTVSGGNGVYHGMSLSGACTVNVLGDLSCTLTGAPLNGIIYIQHSSAVINWIGSRSMAANKAVSIRMSAGTINLATAGGALVLANSGVLSIEVGAGTLTTTHATGGTASIVNQIAVAQAAICGGTEANRAIITGASIPSAADTRYGVTRGWADGGTAATAGCGVAGGNGLLEIPNTDSPTGTQDATSDDCVVSGKKYGSPQRTGTAAGGGGGASGFPRRVMKLG